jgi:hypothetical protein
MMDQRVQEVFGGIRVIHLIAVSSKLPFEMYRFSAACKFEKV